MVYEKGPVLTIGINGQFAQMMWHVRCLIHAVRGSSFVCLRRQERPDLILSFTHFTAMSIEAEQLFGLYEYLAGAYCTYFRLVYTFANNKIYQ